MPEVQPEPQVEGLPGPAWIVASFAAYVALGLAFKSVVLNWIVGPTWLVVTLYVLPALGRSLAARVGRR
ncbi:MAG: hypothetical protein KDA97_08750 [Acidimicrobiales bacterium]|nr:hypothetical protein [Acidimicrobiales bacterium]